MPRWCGGWQITGGTGCFGRCAFTRELAGAGAGEPGGGEAARSLITIGTVKSGRSGLRKLGGAIDAITSAVAKREQSGLLSAG